MRRKALSLICNIVNRAGFWLAVYLCVFYTLEGAPTIWDVCASGCGHTSLQDAIAHAVVADTGPQIIELKAGENFDTAGGFSLPARTGKYTGWIVIRSSRISELPAKTRVTPSDVAKLATLRVTAGGYAPVLYTSGHPSSYWRLEGLEFTLSTTGLNHQGWLVGLGHGSDTEDQPSEVSHHIVIDRCYVHGIAFDNGPRDGIRVNGDNIEVLNSYISEIKRDDDETHALLGYSLNGPLLVRNTFHGGAAIGSLIGGAASASISLMPNNLQFLGNHYQGTPTHRALRYAADPQGTSVPGTGVSAQTYWKTDTSELYLYSGAWRLIATSITGNICVDGDFWENTGGPTYFTCTGGVWVAAGGDRTITGGTASPFAHFWSKNRFELKKVTGALVEGNLIENCFSPTDGSQACSAILFNWVTDQDGPWATIREVSVQNNLIRRTSQVATQGVVSSVRIGEFTHRRPRLVVVENNLISDTTFPSTLTAYNNSSFYYYPPMGNYVGGVGIFQYSNQRFAHNTLVAPLASSIFWPMWQIHGEGNAAVGIDIADNVLEAGNTVDAASDSTGGGGCTAFNSLWTSSRLKNNLIVQLGQGVSLASATSYDTSDCRSWGFPWKRTGTGVWYAASSGSIAGGQLTISFSGPTGMYQNTRIKLAGWTPAGLNATYTIPRLWCGSGSEIQRPTYQSSNTICVPTAETGAVTPGTVEASVDYTDYAAGNFRLAATSAYKGWATDGSDPGANQDMVEWATASASSGADNPYLDFRVRAVTPTADGAVIRFTAYSDAACTWKASSTRAFSDDLGSWGSGTRIGRDGVITLSGVSANTTYWCRATCDSKTREVEVTTTH